MVAPEQKLTLIGSAIIAGVLVIAELGRRGDRGRILEQDLRSARERSGRVPFPLRALEWLEKKARRWRFALFLGMKHG
jgi:hypothetical protein